MMKTLPTLAAMTPEPFAEWRARGMPLFQSRDEETTTQVLKVEANDADETNVVHVIGHAKDELRFFVEATWEELAEFQAKYAEWLRDAPPGKHANLSDPPGQKPPKCGPPNGPAC
jgi:hypothetical protein